MNIKQGQNPAAWIVLLFWALVAAIVWYTHYLGGS